MKTALLTVVVSPLLLVTLPLVGHATTSTAPLLSIGVQGSYTQLELNGRDNENDDMPEGGLFINFGNKMTAIEGPIYQAEASGMYSKKQNQKLKDGQADLDLGWRLALSERHSVDLLLGAGYKWNRLQPNTSRYDVDLTNRTPFGKIAAGYNYRFNNATLRFEAGIRHVINGDSQLEIHGISREDVDLNDTNNPFAELSVLFNQDGAVPILASLYFSRYNYELDGQFVMADADEQTRDEYGLKVGISF
ncbi:hypothetical protein D3C76_862590 [compost metagenome]|uniref:outer membrane beta-barrel protein n=1 Tax=Pseudomonas putida TaxID=303 RepID=UPI000F99D229|nr:outer membrane beta-barrel protein [Pseudomonas putida]TCP75551.1 outer membrane protein with beta-barrel domain [Pseudomonas putida]